MLLDHNMQQGIMWISCHNAFWSLRERIIIWLFYYQIEKKENIRRCQVYLDILLNQFQNI